MLFVGVYGEGMLGWLECVLVKEYGVGGASSEVGSCCFEVGDVDVFQQYVALDVVNGERVVSVVWPEAFVGVVVLGRSRVRFNPLLYESGVRVHGK